MKKNRKCATGRREGLSKSSRVCAVDADDGGSSGKGVGESVAPLTQSQIPRRACVTLVELRHSCRGLFEGKRRGPGGLKDLHAEWAKLGKGQ